ncbi:tetraacyldisaccharide 4'-kinase [Rhodoferax sp.]|jgi:tetraacyldisaccharide 4'-kinase|uniref:tetraacyldisaccharide 4'-kinase n=1 Tax=Rhodoferax sp. TaxID=50421 RepID=UPI0037849E45
MPQPAPKQIRFANFLSKRWTDAIALWLETSWQHDGRLSLALLPLAWLYRAVFGLRQMLYRTGMVHCHKAAVPVLVVGNVIVGGAGKTPTTIAIVQHLQGQGRRVGVVSRGHGRGTRRYARVDAASRVQDVGDEPLLVFRATQAPVWVGPSRYLAAKHLLQMHPDVELVICDDGLQHYGLYRDAEICVFDNRGCGNGKLLPAGPLREPWPRTLLAAAGQSPQTTLVLHTGTRPVFNGHRAHRGLGPYAVGASGAQRALQELALQIEKPLFAVAGIAQPEAFFSMLRALQLPLAGTLGLRDHADFSGFDVQLAQSFTLLCTEKDAAKLWQVAPHAWAVPLQQTMDPPFWDDLDRLLEPLWAAKLSSQHGQKTA